MQTDEVQTADLSIRKTDLLQFISTNSFINWQQTCQCQLPQVLKSGKWCEDYLWLACEILARVAEESCVITGAYNSSFKRISAKATSGEKISSF